METCETDDGVTFTREGERTRARAEALNYLFAIAEPEVARDTYLQALATVLAHFRPRWEAHATDKVPDGALAAFAREVTLNAMYLYVVNGAPVEITQRDLDHPQTRRILRAHAKKYMRAGTKGELAFCAGVLGLTVDELRGWIEGEKRFQER